MKITEVRARLPSQAFDSFSLALNHDTHYGDKRYPVHLTLRLFYNLTEWYITNEVQVEPYTYEENPDYKYHENIFFFLF